LVGSGDTAASLIYNCSSIVNNGTMATNEGQVHAEESRYESTGEAEPDRDVRASLLFRPFFFLPFLPAAAGLFVFLHLLVDQRAPNSCNTVIKL
jgi:hypothetical protein